MTVRHALALAARDVLLSAFVLLVAVLGACWVFGVLFLAAAFVWDFPLWGVASVAGCVIAGKVLLLLIIGRRS